MNNLRISILNLLLVISFQTIAQADSISVCKEIREMKISRAIKTPLILMSASAFAFTDTDFIGRADIFEDRNENFSSFRTHLDDYIQYAPIAGVITLNALGVRGQNKFSTQMWLLAKSELLMNAIVYPLKRITAVPRPDTGVPTSFPSGHTAQAFVAATFMHREYGKQNPWYSVLAYGTATSVGVLRMMNNRHWSTDVLMGAGIGILSTNLVYLLHNGKRIKKTKLFTVPTYQNGNFGLKAIISLN
jgi:membrane-associated phospholipid phosphatase